MAAGNIPSDLTKYQKKSPGKTDDNENARRKPHFAEKTYQQRAKEAYDKYLGSLSSNKD